MITFPRTFPKVYLTISAAFHAVQSAKELLVKAGFQEIKVSENLQTRFYYNY